MVSEALGDVILVFGGEEVCGEERGGFWMRRYWITCDWRGLGVWGRSGGGGGGESGVFGVSGWLMRLVELEREGVKSIDLLLEEEEGGRKMSKVCGEET